MSKSVVFLYVCIALAAAKTIQQTAEDILTVEKDILREIQSQRSEEGTHRHNHLRDVLRAVVSNVERDDVMSDQFRLSEQEAMDDYEKLLEILMKPRVPEMYRVSKAILIFINKLDQIFLLSCFNPSVISRP